MHGWSNRRGYFYCKECWDDWLQEERSVPQPASSSNRPGVAAEERRAYAPQWTESTSRSADDLAAVDPERALSLELVSSWGEDRDDKIEYRRSMLVEQARRRAAARRKDQPDSGSEGSQLSEAWSTEWLPKWKRQC